MNTCTYNFQLELDSVRVVIIYLPYDKLGSAMHNEGGIRYAVTI